GIFPKDPDDDRRLGRVDPPTAVNGISIGIIFHDDVISIAEATSRLTVSDAAFKTPPRFDCQILQEESIHRALQADVQLADYPLAQRDERDASEGEMLEERRDIL